MFQINTYYTYAYQYSIKSPIILTSTLVYNVTLLTVERCSYENSYTPLYELLKFQGPLGCITNTAILLQLI